MDTRTLAEQRKLRARPAAAPRIDYAIGACSLGRILVATTGSGICAILIDDVREALLRDLRRRFPKATLHEAQAAPNATFAKVVQFVEAPSRGLDVPLDLRGTPFQQRVWQVLCQVPPGTTTSYLEIARRIGAPTSSRAVGAAIAANPIAVAVPCHRVLRSDGGLSGYRWGVDRKRALLEREGQRETGSPDKAVPVAAVSERV